MGAGEMTNQRRRRLKFATASASVACKSLPYRVQLQKGRVLAVRFFLRLSWPGDSRRHGAVDYGEVVRFRAGADEGFPKSPTKILAH